MDLATLPFSIASQISCEYAESVTITSVFTFVNALALAFEVTMTQMNQIIVGIK